jgi:hypothetical protein
VRFTELAWKVAGAEGRVCFVLPLAVAYSNTSAWRSLRRWLRGATGELRFRFFDRTPDSVFGDHVKQRVAIVYRRPSSARTLKTSTFLRWTSGQRKSVFQSDVPHVDISHHDIGSGVPKLGTQWELQLYQAIRMRTLSSRSTFRASDESTWQLAVGATAYNELNLFRGGADPGALPNVSTWRFSSEALASWAYGMLSSDLVYWLWRVEGDGFHVPAAWIQTIPIPYEGNSLDKQLGRLGSSLWNSARDHPTWATNRGRQTVAFRSLDPELVSRADELLLLKLGLASALVDELVNYRHQLISVGRTVTPR